MHGDFTQVHLLIDKRQTSSVWSVKQLDEVEILSHVDSFF